MVHTCCIHLLTPIYFEIYNTLVISVTPVSTYTCFLCRRNALQIIWKMVALHGQPGGEFVLKFNVRALLFSSRDRGWGTIRYLPIFILLFLKCRQINSNHSNRYLYIYQPYIVNRMWKFGENACVYLKILIRLIANEKFFEHKCIYFWHSSRFSGIWRTLFMCLSHSLQSPHII